MLVDRFLGFYSGIAAFAATLQRFSNGIARRVVCYPIFPIHRSQPHCTAMLHASNLEGPQGQLISKRSPRVPVASRLLVQFLRSKLILGQITGQTELLILLILGGVTNVDLVVSRIGIDIVVFFVSLHEHYFIWWEGFEMLLPLRSVCDNGPKACRREQILCRLRMSVAAHSQG